MAPLTSLVRTLLFRKTLLAMMLIAVVSCRGAARDASAPAGPTPASEQAAMPPDVTGSQQVSEVAAYVNGAAIPMEDFMRQARDAQSYLVKQGVDPNTADGAAQLQAVRVEVMEDLISQALIEQAAVELGIEVSEAELEADMQTMLGEAGGEEGFRQRLSDVGLTEQQFRELQRRAILGQKVTQHIAAGASDTAEQVRARHVVVASREEAEQVLQRLRSGADFGQLVRELSLDEASARQELPGDLGWLARGRLEPELEEMAFSLPPGQLSGVVQTALGFHIIEVLERDVARRLSDEALNDVREARVLDWLRKRRTESEIEILVPDLDELEAG
jgi:parvulin-like peptidyl-prolyl isomerase